MRTTINEVKTSENIFHAIENASLIVHHVIEIKNEIIRNVNVNIKSMASVNKN